MAKVTKKKKIIAAVAVVVSLAIIATVVGVAAGKKKGTEITLDTIGTSDIQSVISATADVQPGSKKEYKVATAATVLNVYVKVGDHVQAGQQLATFDTSELDTQIAGLRKEYAESKESYNASVKASKDAAEALKKVKAEIASLQQEIENSGTPDVPQVEIPGANANSEGAKKVEALYTDACLEAFKKFGSAATDVQINEIFAEKVAKGLEDGSITVQDLRDYTNGQVDIETPNISQDQITQMVNQISSVSKSFALSALKLQQQALSVSSSSTVTDVSKQLMNTMKSTLDTLVAQRDKVAEGWKADFNGVISAVNIEPGQTISLLTTGIVLDGTDNMTAVITLGKYDIQKVSVGMPCKISVVNGEYDGQVSFIAPTAADNSSSSKILDSVSSSMGISGLGSLTQGTTGLRCEITINNPDEKVVIGLDANVEIIVGEEKDVISIPIESIKLDKTGKYCFVYNEEEKCVEKRELKVGATSDTMYEVIDGLKVGDKVVATPSSEMKDGDAVYVAAKK